MKLYKPEIFQGNLSLDNYFEGWYFKHVSPGLDTVYSFIPGVSLNGKNRHAFIQVINGITGKTDYLTYPPEEFSWRNERFYVRVGDSEFTPEGISLSIQQKGLRIKGELRYSHRIQYPRSIFSPGIMGWYSFIPYMECKHGVVSVNHLIKGFLEINNERKVFDGGKGYIEKDWGTSFPEAWIWIQANTFREADTSFMFSVAKIPWRGKFFTGFIAFLHYKGKFYLYSTYNGSKINHIYLKDGVLNLELQNRTTLLKVQTKKNNFGELIAPVSGDMSRRIKESIDSEVQIEFSGRKTGVMYRDNAPRAGLEIIEKIFEYL